MKTYTVYFHQLTQGEIDVKAESEVDAILKVENCDVDWGTARQYDEPIEVDEAEEK